jgi:hypothetical protein
VLIAEVFNSEIRIPIKPRDQFALTPTDDPTLGRQLSLNGRVLGENGGRAPSGLPVGIWGPPPDAKHATARACDHPNFVRVIRRCLRRVRDASQLRNAAVIMDT